MKKPYGMGLSLSLTTHHEFGKGAGTTPVATLAHRAYKKTHSWKHVVLKARELANINENRNPRFSSHMRAVEQYAHEMAIKHGEYKYQKKRMRV